MSVLFGHRSEVRSNSHADLLASLHLSGDASLFVCLLGHLDGTLTHGDKDLLLIHVVDEEFILLGDDGVGDITVLLLLLEDDDLVLIVGGDHGAAVPEAARGGLVGAVGGACLALDPVALEAGRLDGVGEHFVVGDLDRLERKGCKQEFDRSCKA